MHVQVHAYTSTNTSAYTHTRTSAHTRVFILHENSERMTVSEHKAIFSRRL